MGTDGGVGDAAGDAAASVMSPDIPWLADGVPAIAPPALTPCPPGWHEVTVAATTECHPYGSAGPETCPAGEAHFPGEPGCRTVGDVCPSGDWPTGLPTDGVLIHVKADAAAGGDGSLGRPYAGLGEVPWISLRAGATVALAKGAYEGVVSLKAGVAVIGACARDTVLHGLAFPVPSVVAVSSRGEPAILRNLTIAEAPQRGIQVGAGYALTVRGVVITGAREIAVLASGSDASVVLEDTVITRTRRGSSDGRMGVALFVNEGAQLEATRLMATENVSTGVVVLNRGTVATLVDAVIQASGTAARYHVEGAGMDVGDGAELTATRLLVSDSQGAGVVAGDSETRVTLTDVVVRGNHPREFDGLAAFGIGVFEGAHVEVTRSTVAENSYFGISVDGVDSSCVLTDVIVRNTRPNPTTELLGRGISVEGGARLDATRIVVHGNHNVGAVCIAEGSVLTLADAVVEGTRHATGDLSGAAGVVVQVGGRIEASRVLVADNDGLGVFSAGAGAELSLVDTVVRDTLPRQSDDLMGRGVNVQFGASLMATRLLVEDNHDVGVFTTGAGTTVSLADTVVREMKPRRSDGSMGRGIFAQEGAHIDGARVRIEDVQQLGLAAVLDSEVALRDVTILRVPAADCAASGACPEMSYAYGAASIGATLSLSHFAIDQSAVCGVFVAPLTGAAGPSALDLATGTVRDSVIGACVQVDGYDIGRLTNEVRYEDNGTPLDSTTLPVPQPLGTGEP